MSCQILDQAKNVRTRSFLQCLGPLATCVELDALVRETFRSVTFCASLWLNHLNFTARMRINYVENIAQDGFAVVEELLDSETINNVLGALANAKIEGGESQRAGKFFGIKNLLNAVPFTRELANNSACRSIVEPILGSTARIVRGIYFDKHKDANWKVAWHQDLTIAVPERFEVDGYGPWSIKEGSIMY